MGSQEFPVSGGRSKRVKVEGYGFLWRSWLWFAWFLGPAAMLIRTLAGVGGWDTLFIIFFSPVLVPALGLLGALPRFVLRRRGHRSIPPAVAVFSVASGWGLVLALLSMRGVSDGPSMDSFMRLISSISERAEAILGTVSFAVCAGAYVVAVVLAFTVKPGARADWGERPSNLAAGLSIALVPVLLLGAALVGDLASMWGERDFGGAREADVAFLSAAEQRERQAAQWEAAQAQLAPLRGEVAPDRWEFSEFRGVDAETSGPEPRGYFVDLAWHRMLRGDPLEAEQQVTAAAERAGWSLESERNPSRVGNSDAGRRVWEDDNGAVRGVRNVFVNELGYRATAWIDRVDEEGAEPGAPRSKLRLVLSSGKYWQSRGEQPDWYAERGSTPLPPYFVAEEWPSLEEAAAAPAP